MPTSSALLSVVPQLVHPLLHLIEFSLKVNVVNNGRGVSDIAQQLQQLAQFRSMLVNSVLHQVVAIGTVNTALLAVVLILLALVAVKTLNIIVTLYENTCYNFEYRFK
jgi:hypothetical protein